MDFIFSSKIMKLRTYFKSTKCQSLTRRNGDNSIQLKLPTELLNPSFNNQNKKHKQIVNETISTQSDQIPWINQYKILNNYDATDIMPKLLLHFDQFIMPRILASEPKKR